LEGAGCRVDLDNGLQQVAGLGPQMRFAPAPCPSNRQVVTGR
jgi:hypothetical protein